MEHPGADWFLLQNACEDIYVFSFRDRKAPRVHLIGLGIRYHMVLILLGIKYQVVVRPIPLDTKYQVVSDTTWCRVFLGACDWAAQPIPRCLHMCCSHYYKASHVYSGHRVYVGLYSRITDRPIWQVSTWPGMVGNYSSQQLTLDILSTVPYTTISIVHAHTLHRR